MLKIMKLFIIIIFGIILTITSCFERNDMYDFAKNGVKVIYAINSNSSKVYIATDTDYFKYYSVTTTTTDTGIMCYPLNGKLIAVEFSSTDLLFHKYDRSTWTTITDSVIGNVPSAIFLLDNKIYYSFADNIYYFTTDSCQLLQTMITPATFISMTEYNGEIYLFTGSSIYKYENDDTANDTQSGTIITGSIFKSFDIVDGIAYIGYDNRFNYNRLGANSSFTTVSPSGINSYAIYNSSAIFAAGYSTQFEIMKFKEGLFVTIKQIADSGTIVIKALSETKLAVGISGSASHDGLYVLDTETGKMKTLATDSIAAINIFDHLY